MTYSFNLVDQKWIPCLPIGETQIELFSLSELFREARDLQSIECESPLETAALHRILLVILHRVFGPQSRREWGNLWQDGTGSWDQTCLYEYLNSGLCYPRLDLFDSKSPFFQSIEERKKFEKAESSAKKEERKKIIPVTKLIQELSAGNNPTLFDHHTDKSSTILTPARAAQAIIATQAFGLSMSGGYSAGCCASHIIFFIKGINLFETLALNLIRYPDPPSDYPEDKPAWEQDNPLDKTHTVPYGRLDYFTWLSRRVWLSPETADDGSQFVQWMTISPGLKLPDTVKNKDYDPMKHYIVTGQGKRALKHKFEPMRFKENRSLWRDSSALFTLKRERPKTDGVKNHFPPLSFEWLCNLVANYELDEADAIYRYRYMAFGMSTNQASIEFIRSEQIPIPLNYLKNDRWIHELTRSVTIADEVSKKLWHASFEMGKFFLYPDMFMTQEQLDEKRKKVISTLLGNHWGVIRHFWIEIEPAFYRLLDDLPENHEKAQKAWWQALEKQAKIAFNKIEEAIGSDMRAMKAMVAGSKQFDKGLGQVYKEFFGKQIQMGGINEQT